MSGKFEIGQSKSNKYLFNLKTSNSQVILTSLMYQTKGSAENGIHSVKANVGTDARFERSTATNGKPYFTLKATNGEIIGRSELYATAAAMEKGISSVKSNAPDASVVDLT